MLLSIAVIFALVFAAALAYVGYLITLSLAGGPVRYVILAAVPLAISLTATLLLARVESSRRSTDC